MRNTWWAMAAIAATMAMAPAASAQLPLAESEGVELVRNIPVNGSVGANFKTYEGDGTYMFVTGTVGASKLDPGIATAGPNAGGLFVYDIDDAEDPKLAAFLPFPHYQNENVSIGGDRLLISGDGTLGGSNLAVIDISEPRSPKVEFVIHVDAPWAGHTADCIQDCRYVWVSGDNRIQVIDLDERPNVPAVADGVPGINLLKAGGMRKGHIGPLHEFGWGTHDVDVDESGIAWVAGGNGTIGFDVSPDAYGEWNLTEPKIVARTGPDAVANNDISKDTVNDFIHHNSLRPNANEFRSRPDSELGDDDIRPGEVVLITEEDIWSDVTLLTKGGCENAGSFQTWQVKQHRSTPQDQATLSFLDDWKTEFTELQEQIGMEPEDDDVQGMDVIPTNGFCSAHYFDERDGLVAAAFYEQGTRLLDTSDPRNIRQVGYFLAADSAVWAAYWSPTGSDVAYVMDHQRGIDVLKLSEGGSAAERRTVKAPFPSWWKRKRDDQGRLWVKHPKFGWVCRLS